MGLVACAPAPAAPPPARAVVFAASRAPLRRILEAPATCGRESLRVEMSGDLERRCWPEGRCERALQFRVSNCTNEPLDVGELSVGRTKGDRRGYEFTPDEYPVAAHSERTFEFGWSERDAMWPLGGHTVTIRAFPPGSAWSDTDGWMDRSRRLEASTSFAIRDPAREDAEATCRANGDDWGLHGGMIQTEGCQAVMHDAGKRCVDGRDCEGRCRLEKEWRISATQKRVQGTCTRYATRFGCNAFIGDTDQGLMPTGAHFARMCVD